MIDFFEFEDLWSFAKEWRFLPNLQTPIVEWKFSKLGLQLPFSLTKFVRVTRSWAYYFDQVSQRYGKNEGFSIYGIF